MSEADPLTGSFQPDVPTQMQGVAATAIEQTSSDGNGRLALLADYIALRLSRFSELGLAHPQILGTIKAAGEHLRGQEMHDLFGLVAMHPNVTPCENGNFAYKVGATFSPQTEGFMASRYAEEALENEPSNGKPDGQPMTRGQMNRLIKDMHSTPQFQRMRAERGRLANPRRRSYGRRK